MNSSLSPASTFHPLRASRAQFSPLGRRVASRVAPHPLSVRVSVASLGRIWNPGLLDRLQMPPLTRYHE